MSGLQSDLAAITARCYRRAGMGPGALPNYTKAVFAGTIKWDSLKIGALSE
jgi:hypothetical protein